jgi:hypothetical protein
MPQLMFTKPRMWERISTNTPSVRFCCDLVRSSDSQRYKDLFNTMYFVIYFGILLKYGDYGLVGCGVI